VQTGKVRFGYQQLAVLGPESEWAAQASECANEQGAFWPYHDKLYASQQGKNQGAFSKEKLKAAAGELKLDTARFDRCFDAGKYARTVAAETDTGKAMGIRATPTFLVNGQVFQGALPFEEFEKVIDQALAVSK
jgi:protein-disulfide isomerase